MVHQLACWILVDHAMGGTLHQGAFKPLVAALRAYRTGEQAGRQHRLNLKKAEHELIEAIAEDARFDLAFYNLGIVYGKLGHLDAADGAFLQSIAINNLRWSAYYAMASNHYVRALRQGTPVPVAKVLLLKAADFCDRAIRLAPNTSSKAQILNQKSLIIWRSALITNSAQRGYDSARTALRAVSMAWRAMCLIELTCLQVSAKKSNPEILPAPACKIFRK